MAFWDLEITITVKEKGRVLSKISEVSNNDILDMNVSWRQYLEQRIVDLGYKVSGEVKLKRIR